MEEHRLGIEQGETAGAVAVVQHKTATDPGAARQESEMTAEKGLARHPRQVVLEAVGAVQEQSEPTHRLTKEATAVTGFRRRSPGLPLHTAAAAAGR